MYKLILKHSVKILFLLLFMFISAGGIAQSDPDKFLPNIVPPSPTAGELGKFGNVPVGLFTGSANLSIPLISFKAKDLESPISLFYGSNGIKVDEVSSNVGLGWNLNFGGVITRTVRDKNDDALASVYPPDDLANATEAQRVQFYKSAGQATADTERDQYSFNFNGNSGKFTYDKNGVPFLVNNQKIKIERTGTGNADFVITGTNGVKYFFTEKESTSFRNSGSGQSVISSSVTAWYLSKIVHLNGPEIYLTYDDYNMDYVSSNSQSLEMSYPPMQFGCGGVLYSKAPTLSGINTQNMTVMGKRVNKIWSNNATDGYVIFTYSGSGINEEVVGNSKIANITLFNAENIAIEKIDFNYLKTANQRVFLQNITFADPTKKYSFEYISQTQFPQRLSYSQDHWGYYNGKSNTNLVPKYINQYGLDDINYNGADKEPDGNFAQIGLLKRVIYPTKGYTEFDYESNTYWGQKTTYPPKINLKISRAATDNSDIPTETTFTSPVNQRVEFRGWCTYVPSQEPRYDANGNLIPDPYDTGNYSASLQIVDTADPNKYLDFYEISQFGTPFLHPGSFRFINKVTNNFYFDAVAGKTYKLYFSKTGLRAYAMTDIIYYGTAPVIVNTNIVTGGVRIKSTRDYTALTATPVYKRYYYAGKDDLNHSSGDKGRSPLYMEVVNKRAMCPSGGDGLGLCLFTDLSDLVVSSSSMISLFDTGNSNCFYKYVTVSEGGDNFENGGEMKEFIVHRDNFGQLLLGSDIQSAPFTNFGWDNGLEVKSQILQKKNSTNPFVIVSETQNNYKLDPAYANEIKAYSVRKNYDEPCPNVNTVENLSIIEYKTKAYWFYLESTTSKNYDLNGLNPIETTTTYQYVNSLHIQLTSQSTKSSFKETVETKFYYPQDLAMVNEPFISEMIDANRIDTPLKTETLRAGVKQSEQKTEYAKDASTSNLLLPKFIYAAKFPNSLDTSNSLEKKITYDKYDNIGNIMQYTLESGMPVSIIWGYNKTKPIAKVENAVYNDAITAYSTNENTFRNNLSNAMITTYSYKPLIGISTITDPKGLTTYYEYDEYNRLKMVKDSQGNIISENQYHYKN